MATKIFKEMYFGWGNSRHRGNTIVIHISDTGLDSTNPEHCKAIEKLIPELCKTLFNAANPEKPITNTFLLGAQ